MIAPQDRGADGGQGRQPPEAGARSASLEPGRAPVYSTQLLPGDEFVLSPSSAD